jgi:hypothetical protein
MTTAEVSRWSFMPCKGAYLAAVRGTVGQHPLSLNIKIVISGRRIGMRFCRDFEWFMNGILLTNRILC